MKFYSMKFYRVEAVYRSYTVTDYAANEAELSLLNEKHIFAHDITITEIHVQCPIIEDIVYVPISCKFPKYTRHADLY